MSYGLFLYKNIETEGGRTARLEIHQEGYTFSALEIDALQADSLNLTLDNQNNPLESTIIRSSLTFGIIDTGQIDYTVFFTPSAIKYKIIYKLNGATEWTGYITPDSYVENINYRDVIQITARDNVGMLDELNFNYSIWAKSVQISTLIAYGLNAINFPMNYTFQSVKTSDGQTFKDVIINFDLYKDKTWKELFDIFLTSFGIQFRYVGGNSFAFIEVGDLRTLGGLASQGTFDFVNKSGIREIVPAWKTVNLIEKAGLRDSVYKGELSDEEYIYDYTDTSGTPGVKMYKTIPTAFDPTREHFWMGDLNFLKPIEWNAKNESIYIVGGTFAGSSHEDSMSYKIALDHFDYNMKIVFNISNTLKNVFQTSLGNTLLKDSIGVANYYLKFRCNIFFETSSATYILRNNWQVYNYPTPANMTYLEFSLPNAGYGSNPTQEDVDISINIASMPYAGRLVITIYPFQRISTNVVPGFMCINSITIPIDNDFTDEKNTSYTVNSGANIKQTIELPLAQVPLNRGGKSVFDTGIFKNDTYNTPLQNWMRGAYTYPLGEMIFNEIANHYRTSKNKLSGQIVIPNKSYMPSFRMYYTKDGKDYLLNYASLNVLSEQMSVELIEITNFAPIASPPSTTTTTTIPGTTTTTTEFVERLMYPYYGYSASSRQGAYDNGYPEFNVIGILYFDQITYKIYTTESGSTEVDEGWYLTYVGADANSSSIFYYSHDGTTTSTTTTTTIPGTTTTTTSTTTTTTIHPEREIIAYFGYGATKNAAWLDGYPDFTQVGNIYYDSILGKYYYSSTGSDEIDTGWYLIEVGIDENSSTIVYYEKVLPTTTTTTIPGTTTTTTSTTTSTTTTTTESGVYGAVYLYWGDAQNAGNISINNVYINNIELTDIIYINLDEYKVVYKIPESLFGVRSLKVNANQTGSNNITAYDSEANILGGISMSEGSYDYVWNGGTYGAHDEVEQSGLAYVRIYFS